MKPKALIVEDDDRIIETIGDVLFSLGHEYDWATNQHDARQMLRERPYDYVLLDLQIPAKPNRGGADKEFGGNLLCDIQEIKGRGKLPVVVMTAFSADCLDMTTELHANGATEFISKPFSNKGRTLAGVIRKVLAGRMLPPTSGNAAQKSAVPFAGGQMAFFPRHVELLGVKIISDRVTGQCMAVLDQLRRKDGRGRFVRLSAEELAETIQAPGGIGTITGCIQTLRRNIVKRLGKAGIVAHCSDVIDHNEQGYFLREWIEVCDGDARKCPCDVPAGTPSIPADVPAGSSNVPAAQPAGPAVNHRQQWILNQLGRGVRLQRTMVQREFGVGEKTAKRDLSELVQRRMIEYRRTGREGAYCLAAIVALPNVGAS